MYIYIYTHTHIYERQDRRVVATYVPSELTSSSLNGRVRTAESAEWVNEAGEKFLVVPG